MKQNAIRLFGPPALPDGVRRLHFVLLRVLFVLMFVFLGWDAWSHIFTFDGEWAPAEAAAWTIWAATSVLALVGVLNPLKMIPLVLLEILYKGLWLGIVAYPLVARAELRGSPAEEMTYAFLWIVLPIVALPWAYVWRVYVRDVRALNIA